LSEIAKELGCEKRTVHRVVKPRPKPKRQRPSKLDPFRPLVRKLVLEDDLSSVRVLEEIRAIGYTGSYTILKQFVRGFRPKSHRRPHERFETAPGEQGQVDLSTYTLLLGQLLTKVVCFSMIFGFSRWQFIHFLLHADAHSVSHCHVMAFEEAGGAPLEMLYDRMKQVVLESFKDGVLFHPLFERLVAHYGYTAIPLAPGYCEGKGKVEKPFQYVEDNFLKGRVFHDLDDLNAQAKAWRAEKAERDHRTTHEQPAARLDQERPRLLALPPERFDAAQLEPRVVDGDYCIAWDTNRYSVSPRLIGRQAWGRALMGKLEVLVGKEVVAEHRLRDTRFQRYVLPEHEAEFYRKSRSSHLLGEQFARLGPSASEFEKGLREEKRTAAGYHMSRILELAGKVGIPPVAEALRHAARYQAFDSHAVERIVTGRHPRRASQAPSPDGARALPAPLAEYLKGAGDFQRGPGAYQRFPQPPPENPEGKDEVPDGQRRDGPAASPAEEAPPAAPLSEPR
jgi:transposase